ncbi:MAG: anti-sigma factor family protein [Mycobacteriales bacterium]
MRCDEVRISLGVYLVGAIDAGERAEVDEHLRTCARCRAELDDLAILPSMLDQLSLQDVDEVAPAPLAPESLFARVAAQARLETENEGSAEAEVRELSRYRRRRAFLAAAAAVVLIGGASATAVTVLSSGSNVHTGVQGQVHMRVAVSSQATGSTLRVEVSGLPEDEHCWLYAIGADGTKELVSAWEATYEGEAQVTGSTSIEKANLSRLVLQGDGGKQLVTVQV